MTAPGKEKINRIIAEKMGWTFSFYSPSGIHYDKGVFTDHEGKLRFKFNPYDSISDAFEAWEKLIKQPYWGILMQPFKGHLWTFTVRYEAEDITASRIVTSAEAETPAAAISLALEKHIKEM